MAAPTLTWSQVLALKPCAASRMAADARLSAAFPDFASRPLTMADAVAAGVERSDLIWLAAKIDPRRTRLFAADRCARVSHLLEDARSVAAIVAARRFARGEITAAAWAAAWDATRDATWGATRDDARVDAWVAAKAATRLAAGAAAWDDAGDDEHEWQRQRLAEWFSAREPEDWPITDNTKGEAAQ